MDHAHFNPLTIIRLADITAKQIHETVKRVKEKKKNNPKNPTNPELEAEQDIEMSEWVSQRVSERRESERLIDI